MTTLELGPSNDLQETGDLAHPLLIQRGISLLETELHRRGRFEIRDARDTLLDLLSHLNPTKDEYRQFFEAEAILWVSEYRNEEIKIRRDHKLYPWHGYAVAIRTLEMGGGVNTATCGLIHDTIENSGGVVNKGVLADIFGEHIAETVHLLSQVRSRKRKETAGENAPMADTLYSREKTMMRLFQLPDHDPRGVVVKIADRVNFWETSGVMPEDTLQEKARETLMYYVPLAKSFGHFREAIYLADAAFDKLGIPIPDYMVINRKAYQRVLNKFTILCTGNSVKRKHVSEGTDAENHRGLTGWIDFNASLPRMPDRYDVYKTINTLDDIDRLKYLTFSARPPVIVPFIVDAAPFTSDRVGPDEWETKVHGLAQWLVESGYIPQSTLTKIEEEMQRDKRSIRVHFMFTDTADGTQVPVQLLFIRHEDHRRWKATIYDQESPDELLQTAAKEKIRSLQSVYKNLKDFGEHTALSDMLYCLGEGTKVVIVNDSPVGISSNGTVLDALYVGATIEDLGQIVKGVSVTSVPDGRTMALDEVVNEQTKMAVTYIKNGMSLHPDWFTKCRMPSTVRFIQDDLEARLQISLRWLDESTRQEIRKMRINKNEYLPLRDELLREGLSVLKDAFFTLADEIGGHAEDMQTSFIDLIDLYKVDSKKIYFTDPAYADSYADKKVALQCANFIYCLALRKPGYTLDAGRRNSVWAVAREMAIRQLDLVTVELKTTDKQGELARITRILTENKINIRDISATPYYFDDPTKVIFSLTLSPEDAQKVQGAGLAAELGVIGAKS